MFNPNEVRCAGCDEWVTLTDDADSLPRRHRERCLGERKPEHTGRARCMIYANERG